MSIGKKRMDSQPNISVIMPVYNCQKYLALAIESILAQTFGQFEFIIVDDGSTDQSLAIAQMYAKNDGRIEIISRPNTGIVGALNDGLAAARGKYIARMDADDISYPDRFLLQFEYMEANPDCVLLGSRVLLIDADGDPIREWIDLCDHDGIDNDHLNHGWPMIHPAVMMRTSALRQIGGYREEYKWQEDLDIFIRLAEVGKVANLPQTLLKYRKHEESVCSQKWMEQRAIRKRLYADTAQRRGLQKSLPDPPPEMRVDPPHTKHLTWAWWALGAGNVQTARKYARSVVRHAPLKVESWKVMYCALRGH